jgi:aspartyl protease family protein
MRALGAGTGAWAQTVTLNGSMGSRAALLIIDGQPRTVAVGSSALGVRLLSVGSEEAEIEVGGQRLMLRVGAAPVSLGAVAVPRGNEVVLTAGLGGHFMAAGRINGKAVQFLVDTGATAVTLSQVDADRIGLNYRQGGRIMAQTANGAVQAHIVTLSSVRVGDVEVANVQALVLPAPMSHVLLGNSFLTRFQMKRENDVMRLEKRP